MGLAQTLLGFRGRIPRRTWWMWALVLSVMMIGAFAAVLIHVGKDNFENIVVNITKEQFETQRRGRSFRITFKRDEEISSISETYADVPEGEKLALFNSGGYLEIAINKGNAAGLFGLQGFTEQSQNLQNRLFYQTVKIFFS